MKWLRRLAFVLVVLGVLVAGFAWFTFGTERGARFTFNRLVALTEGRLSIGGISGRLPAPLTLTNVRYRDPAAGMDVAIERLVIDVGATAALSRRALVESLDAEGVVVRLTSVPTDPENESPWRPPLDFIVERASVTRLAIFRDGEPLPRFDRIELAGAWTQAGIAIRRFDARGPDGRLDLAGAFDSARGHRGSARGTFAWRVDGVAWAGELDAKSDGRTARATIALRAPMRAAVLLTAAPSDDELPWTIVFDAPAFDPAVLGVDDCRDAGAQSARRGAGAKPVDCASTEPSPPTSLPEGEGRTGGAIRTVAAKIEGSGTRRRFALAGDVVLDAHRLRLERFDGVLREDEVLVLDALRVSSPDAPGSLEASGEVDLAAQPARARLALAWHDVVVPADIAGRELATHGTLSLDGTGKAYAANGRFAFGPPGRTADIDVRLTGTPGRIALESLKLVQAGGGLDATGTLTLEPELGWRIAATAKRFDPGAFFAEWPGALDFALESSGTNANAGVAATVQVESLAGELRGRRVSGDANLVISPGRIVDGTATLRSGDSRIEITGRGGAETDVRAVLDVASLADFIPGTLGRIEGEVAARGTWPALDVDADLVASGLIRRGLRARALTLRADVVDLETRSGTLAITAQDVEAAGKRFDTLTLSAEGNSAQHRLALDASGETGAIELELAGAALDGGWQGTVSKLALEPQPGVRLVLEDDARVTLAGGAWSVSESCFAVTDASPDAGEPGTDAGRACIASERAADASVRASYRVERVPIALVVALASPGAPLRTEGVLDGSGTFARTPAGAWNGTGNLASASGVVAYPDTAEQPLLRYTQLALEADVAPGRTRASLRAALDDGGTIAGNLTIDGETLGGRVDGEVRSLAFLELLTPEIVSPRGALSAHYVIGGTPRAPRLDGSLELAGFRAELPTLGLKLREGRATLRGDGADRYVVDGSVQSGEGVLKIAGRGGSGSGAPLELAITGERVLATDIPGVKILASPALAISRADEAWRVRGKVTLPSASINLRRLPGGGATKASRDVVVVDAGTAAEEESTLPLDVDVVLALGDDVEVRGYGLDGEVEGQLRVRERPGRSSTGTGQIRISGKYRAYGQDLTIERGRLLFAQSPLDDPGLDIRAVRKLREVSPGLKIEGTAKAPVLTVFSVPPMEQGNALSYLVTGRPLRSLSGEDGDTVGMAARALGTATGDLLAKSIGAKMGVDDIGVAESDALGGAAFTVGKYLSPRLYLSYGIGVFDPGQVVTLRYQLSERWEIEANSGTVENRAGVNYKYERD